MHAPETTLRFALNHMVAPRLKPRAFSELARRLGLTDIEIRNNLPENAIADGTPPGAIRALAQDFGLSIVSINALSRFNDWGPERSDLAHRIADYAAECGAEGIVLVPENSGKLAADPEAPDKLVSALERLKEILASRGLTGFVEPLGFASCSLRYKRDAVAAIERAGGQNVFRLVHDTFHHHVAGETDLFVDWTGIVHISGVPGMIPAGEMRDSHRRLVGEDDAIGNVVQMRALRSAGFEGPFSFEPFAPELHELTDITPELASSIEYLQEKVC
jgi:2-keto-myo-inositol isomerase